MQTITIQDFLKKKREKKKITLLTAYDSRARPAAKRAVKAAKPRARKAAAA